MDLARLSQKELAKLLRVEDRTVRNLKDENIPLHGEGKALYYVWDEVEPWWFDRRMRAAGLKKTGGADVPDLYVSEARKAAADAEMAEMKAEIMKGTHLSSAAAEIIWTNHIAAAKAQLITIGPRVSAQLVDGMTVSERRALIDEGVFSALAELEQGTELEALA
jgi:phage terminase Nu1 subunit (DNA packaging protein)